MDYLTALYSEKEVLNDTMEVFNCDLLTAIQIIRNIRLEVIDEDLMQLNEIINK